MTPALSQPKMRTVETIQHEKRNSELKKGALKFVLFCSALIAAYFAFYTFAESPANLNPDKTHATITVGTKVYDLYVLNNDFNAFVFRLSCWVYGDVMQSIANASFVQINTSAAYFETFTSVAEAMIPIGIGFGAIWALLDLLEKAQMDQMTPEVLIRWAIKLMVMVTIVNNTTQIATWCIDAGNEMMSYVTLSGAAAPNALLDQAYETLKTAGIIKGISMFIEVIIPALSIVVCFLVMLVQIYSRLLECGVRYAFMPLGVSDAFTHGINSPGIRYIKKFFAVCMQGVVLMMIVMAGLALEASNAGGSETLGDEVLSLMNSLWIGSVIMDLVILITMVGAMLKSQQLVNDIVGV